MSIEHTLLPDEAFDDHDHGWAVTADQLQNRLHRRLRFVPVAQDDPLATPLIDELAVEYADRYGGQRDRIHAWLRSYPAEEFEPPSGGLLIGLLDGRPVTGGAFRRFDDTTAELKRIWTDARHRRRGHAKTLMTQLESAIAARGYARVYLTTGDRQPEAEALYQSMGYTRLEEPLPYDGESYPVAFLKDLS
ncbi:GNAT family N-acetyltransferase [Mycolicibacterium sp. 3033]|nr:GNAT family N-acetyltransferase [Mycolicibacterium aurantiacum]